MPNTCVAAAITALREGRVYDYQFVRGGKHLPAAPAVCAGFD